MGTGRTRAVQEFINKLVLFYNLMWQMGYPVTFHEFLREPKRQDQLYREGRSRARAWESPHQYGLAADFSHAYQGFNVTNNFWLAGQYAAYRVGLETLYPIGDKNHLQDPGWKTWKTTSFWSRFFA